MKTVDWIEQIIPITLSHIHLEYPNYLALGMNEPLSGLAPSDIHPMFYGSLDWHSSVHSHWQLVRALRLYPDATFAAAARAALTQSLTAEHGARELAYFEQHPNFERPYGWAWLLQLSAEIRQSPNVEKSWLAALEPLEAFVAQRFKAWLPQLSYPVRSGTHNQTAFALGLVWDWATVVADSDMLTLIAERSRHYFSADCAAPLHYEPSGSDFLSPALAEADLMRRVLDCREGDPSGTTEFSAWLTDFLPDIPADGSGDWLTPVAVTNPDDGQDAHFGGLNLSRSWMLQAIAAAISQDDVRWKAIRHSAEIHAAAGLPYAVRTEYMLSHWVPSFGVYLLTERGLN